jgi:hypothetical protein
MSKCRYYFHFVLIISALVIGGLSLCHSGLWMDGRSNVPNFTAIAMVLLVFSQGDILASGLKKRGN